jgi:urea transport system permease protein
VFGAWLINGAKSWLTAAFPSAWLYALGGLFVVVTLFLPKGIVGLGGMVRAWMARRRAQPRKEGA